MPVNAWTNIELELSLITSLVRKGDFGDIDIPEALVNLIQFVNDNGLKLVAVNDTD